MLQMASPQILDLLRTLGIILYDSLPLPKDTKLQTIPLPLLFRIFGRIVFALQVGDGKRAIKGFDEGIRGMKAGGTRRIVVPPKVIPRSWSDWPLEQILEGCSAIILLGGV